MVMFLLAMGTDTGWQTTDLLLLEDLSSSLAHVAFLGTHGASLQGLGAEGVR